jgi:hypothetical protein
MQETHSLLDVVQQLRRRLVVPVQKNKEKLKGAAL